MNFLVPFCTADTDKATTLQWTTAFLKYIQERHGDSLKKVCIPQSNFRFFSGVVKNILLKKTITISLKVHETFLLDLTLPLERNTI